MSLKAVYQAPISRIQCGRGFRLNRHSLYLTNKKNTNLLAECPLKKSNYLQTNVCLNETKFIFPVLQGALDLRKSAHTTILISLNKHVTCNSEQCLTNLSASLLYCVCLSCNLSLLFKFRTRLSLLYRGSREELCTNVFE